jgi:hypothetical protein
MNTPVVPSGAKRSRGTLPATGKALRLRAYGRFAQGDGYLKEIHV